MFMSQEGDEMSVFDEPGIYRVLVIDPVNSHTLGEWYLTKGAELMDAFDRSRYGVISAYTEEESK